MSSPVEDEVSSGAALLLSDVFVFASADVLPVVGSDVDRVVSLPVDTELSLLPGTLVLEVVPADTSVVPELGAVPLPSPPSLSGSGTFGLKHEGVPAPSNASAYMILRLASCVVMRHRRCRPKYCQPDPNRRVPVDADIRRVLPMVARQSTSYDGTMRTSTWAIVLGATLGASLAQACGESGQEDCLIGSRGCSCTVGGACDPGLSCIDGLCILFGNTNGESSGNDSAGESPSGTMTTANDTTSPTSDADTSASATGMDDGPKLDVGDVTPESGCTKMDLLFVLDSSASMIEERQALAATNAFTQIINTIEAINGGGVDYRIAVTDDNDHGLFVPPGWVGADPWFDSTELDAMAMAQSFSGAVGQINFVPQPAVGCEHVLTSAVDLLVPDAAGFVRPDALLVLVLVTDVDDYGAYDQPSGNSCGFGCAVAPSQTPEELAASLLNDVKDGLEGSVGAIVVAGDPASAAGMNFCGQPGSCGCDAGECDVFHADRLYAFVEAVGSSGYAADLCSITVPTAVETALTETIDLACMNFEPEG